MWGGGRCDRRTMLVPVGEPPSQSLKSVGAGRDICEVGILRKYHFSKKWDFFENLLKKSAGRSFEARVAGATGVVPLEIHFGV